MSGVRLPRWFVPVFILIGVGLLMTALITYFVASQPSVNSSEATSAEVSASPISPTPISSPSQSSSSSTTAQAAANATSIPTQASGLNEIEQRTVVGSTPSLSANSNDTEDSASAPNPTPPPIPTTGLRFDGDRAYEHVLAQVALGPRPTGSDAGWATGDFIINELNKQGWDADSQEFVFKGVRGRNVIGRRQGGTGPITLIGAHYDTRPAADQDPVAARRSEWIEGANDGASGVAVLLELARVLESEKLKNEVWLVFFDAEDRGRLEGWPFSVGARHMAENLSVNPQRVVVVDMVGDADQQIYFEHNSTDELSIEIWNVAAELGYSDYFVPEFRHTIIDDHVPFLERLIPAVDIIDFDYPYWHTVEDTVDKVSAESLEHVGRTLEVWLEEKQ